MRISDWSSDVCSSDLYSFQGARPQAFLDMREHFRRAALAAEKTLLSTPLEMSFRSAPAVLRLVDAVFAAETARRSEEHTSELQSLMRISYAVFCLKKKKKQTSNTSEHNSTLRRSQNTNYHPILT